VPPPLTSITRVRAEIESSSTPSSAATTLAQGVEKAGLVIASGAAKDLLDRLIAATNAPAV